MTASWAAWVVTALEVGNGCRKLTRACLLGNHSEQMQGHRIPSVCSVDRERPAPGVATTFCQTIVGTNSGAR